MDDGFFRMEKVSASLAAQFFQNYEHLGNCGLGVWHWGAFLSRQVVGVVSFGTTCFATNRGDLGRVAATFGLRIYQVSRGGTAIGAPHNTPSRTISRALWELQKEKGDCLVVAYADRKYNEIGTIYQASNALYTGQTNPKDQSNYVIHGSLVSGWVVRKRYGTRSLELLRKIDPKMSKVPLTRKYRYVFVRVARQKHRDVMKALEPLIQPYPSRATEQIAPMRIAELVQNRSQLGRALAVNS